MSAAQIMQIYRGDTEDGYVINSGVLCAADFGAPQKRERFVVMGIKKSISTVVFLPSRKIKDGHYKTVRDAIFDLEDVTPVYDLADDEEGIPLKYKDQLSSMAQQLRNSDILKNHIITKTTDVAMARFKALHQGENFHSLEDSLKTNTYTDIKRTQNSIYLRLNYDDFLCTTHYIRKSVLKELVLADLQRIMSYVKGHEQEFIHTATECSEQAMKKALGHQRKELDKAEARLGEINLLFRKLYEDNALGRLSNEQFVFLTSGYEDEKRELTKRAAELKKEIDTAAERSADVKRFVALVRRYTEISELTYENVHEFIDRILVYELDKDTNTRKIEIFYSFVGKVDTGDQPTESVSYFRQIGADVKSVVV